MTEPTIDADPPARPYDCLVISDLHLGSRVCQAELLKAFLGWAVENTGVLVINGDIFDDLNFKRLNKTHFAALRIIRRNSDRDDLRVIWIRGNHDGPADTMSHIVGVDILDEYVYDNGKIKLLILHGDQFDHFVTHHQWLTAVACGAFYYIQKVFPHRAARWIRRITKRFQRNGRLVERSAIEYARSKGYRFVTCGHTHQAGVRDSGGVRYLNSGTWTESAPCPFVAVAGSEATLEWWPPAGAPEEPAAEENPAETPTDMATADA